MKSKITIATLFLCMICQGLFAQRPLVYSVENTGASCPRPPLPFFDQLPIIQPLTDPFMWSNNLSRSTNFSDWECRRNEIKAEIENYEIGTKPPRPDSITASYAANVLTVNVTKNGQTLVLTCQVALPAGAGPFPAIIGMNSPSGSVPANIFTSRNIARITFNHNQVTTYGNPQNTNPYFRLYPDQNTANSGQYAGWAWGVSRIIDGLELVQATLPIDLKHIGVTGCSYAGKMALFAGAYDERIALTIAQESGGGGAPAWRVSETIGAVENLGATDYNWFKDSMRQFAGQNTAKLPHDHHELMAMVAPRALLVTGNTDFEWLANPSAYVSARAAHEVWKTFGIGDRFGFYIDGGHAHCAVPAAQVPAMEAFVQKFLVGDMSVRTDTITKNPYPTMDYQKWYQWWGSGIPVLPAEPPGIQKWFEAECATVGANWDVLTDTAASKKTYVTVKSGMNSTANAPAGAASAVVFNFTIDSAATYNFNARLNCPTADDDSYWIKVDSGAYVSANGLATTGWQWVRLTNATLAVGPHTFTMAYREDGAKLDKLLITTSNATFTGKGDTATNCGTLPVTFLNNPTIVLNTSCTENGGNITIVPTSGLAPYVYSINGGMNYVSGPNSGYTFAGLGAGTYQLRLKDNSGNESEIIQKTIIQQYGNPPSFLDNLQIVRDATCGRNDGAIWIMPLSGTPPFMYSINGGTTYVAGPNAGTAFMNLAAGTYQLRLKTANGCETPVVTKTIVSRYGNCPPVTERAESDAAVAVSVSPNPSKGQVRVQLNNFKGSKAEILVIDAEGTLVDKVSVSSAKSKVANFDLSRQAPGLYIIRVISADGVHSSKVMIQ